MPQISLSYPVWTLIPALLAALGYALLLYYKNKKQPFGKGVTLLLGFLRFAAVFLLILLLLSPYVMTRKKEVEKPLLLFAQDNSASVVLNGDSAWYKTEYLQKIKSSLAKLSKVYDIDTLLFGTEPRTGGTPDFTDGISDYGKLFAKIKNDYSAAPARVVVVAGDGIYNSGFNPVESSKQITAPVYTLLLVDTVTRRDLFIRDVRYNGIVYRDDLFPLEITLGARFFKGKKARLSVYAFNKKAVDTTIVIPSDRFGKTVKFEIKAAEQGKQHLRIKVSPLAGEQNKKNNTRDIFIDVLNNRQHILILMDGPHPDIAAVRRALQTGNRYVIDVKQISNKLKITGKKYGLIILQGLPRSSRHLALLRQILNEKIPALFLLDGKTNINLFNSLKTGVTIKSALSKGQPAQAVFNSGFTLFHFGKAQRAAVEQLPPLWVPFGNWEVEPGFQVMAYQKTGDIKTGFPLLIFGEKEGTKRGVIGGEGLWLWRLKEYYRDNATEAFDKLISGAVQYLTVRRDKRQFRIVAPETKRSAEEVVLKAELYNDAYEPVTDADIRIVLKDEKGQAFDYNFISDKEGYSLNLGRLSPGVYRYNASVKRGDKTLYDKGEFVVNRLSLESMNTQADAAVMYRIARDHNGELYTARQLDSLVYRLSQSDKIPAKIKYTSRYTLFFDIPLILFLILFLLALEWFVRKYLGGY